MHLIYLQSSAFHWWQQIAAPTREGCFLFCLVCDFTSSQGVGNEKRLGNTSRSETRTKQWLLFITQSLPEETCTCLSRRYRFGAAFFSAPAAPQGLVKRTPEIAVSVWGQASNIALAVVTLVSFVIRYFPALAASSAH